MGREFLNVLLSPTEVVYRTGMCDSELHIPASRTASHTYRLQSSFPLQSGASVQDTEKIRETFQQLLT
jgi:hypothetical protein